MSAVPIGQIAPSIPEPANDANANGPVRDPFSGAETWQPTPREEEIVVAIAAAAMPGGTILEAGGRGTLARLHRMMRGAPSAWRQGYRAMLWSAELAPLATRRRTLSRLSRDEAEAFLDAWSNGRTHLQRSLLRAVLTPIKYAHFDAPHMFAHVGCRYETPPVVLEERPRWLERVTDGRALGRDEGTLELEAEVVIVGTGAGGASAAYELARRGHAVLMLEEGDYHRRGAFTGRANDMTKLLYRDMGLTLALGNVGIPVWAGRAVGGSTTINSGTCYRTPERTFSRWRARYGLDEYSSASMSPFYERVESMLQVAPAKRDLLGGVGRVVERGARRLGLVDHHPLPRNAPDCDGQGICCFGCPTGAKRSTDVSYVPEALKLGAELLTAAKVDKVDVVAGRARGVSGRLHGGRPFVVRAKAVIVAAGTIYTPGILRASGLRHGWIGKNLSIHPATKVIAAFDEVVDQSNGIPQGYAIEDLAEEGIMFEGGSAPFDVTAIGVPYVGRRLMDVMANFPHIATFGMMVQDVSRGSIKSGPGGKPIIVYDLGAYDLARLQKGVVKLSELFRAAGARTIYPFVVGSHEVRTQGEIDALARRTLKPGDIEVTAFHPLGTARIGTDERRSVLTPDQETREVGNLYVMDGAAVPSSLGVNPQMTIMAMSLRACERLSARLNASC